MIEPILYHPEITGCTDGGCIFQDNRVGMHTNGGCQCRKNLMRSPEGKKAVREISWLRDLVKALSLHVYVDTCDDVPLDEAMRLAGLWSVGKMAAGDAEAVSIALYKELTKLKGLS